MVIKEKKLTFDGKEKKLKNYDFLKFFWYLWSIFDFLELTYQN